ncbi:MAG: DUF393 domain-containing protein [Candidatus Melainabacteria bacterium]|nr:DUF393 domain-containing protein [Candidatus Melainabacteria bacterium]
MLKKISLFVLLIILSAYVQDSIAKEKFPHSKTLDKQTLREIYKVNKYYWVIYDSICPYCRDAKKNIKLLDWESKFQFLSYRDDTVYKLFPNLTKEACERDVHMVTPTGEVIVGYQVFKTIIDNLAATKVLNPLLHNDFAEKKLREIYEKMVKKRTCYYNKSNCKLKKK